MPSVEKNATAWELVKNVGVEAGVAAKATAAPEVENTT